MVSVAHCLQPGLMRGRSDFETRICRILANCTPFLSAVKRLQCFYPPGLVTLGVVHYFSEAASVYLAWKGQRRLETLGRSTSANSLYSARNTEVQ